MNRIFNFELDRLIARHRRGRNVGNALTSAERGIILADRVRGRGLNISDSTQAQKVVNLSRALTITGRGLIGLDVGLRLYGVNRTRQDGGHWRRELAVQAGGFTAASGAGYAVGMTARALMTSIALGSGPAGWIVLIGAIGIGIGLAMAADSFGQRQIGGLWDSYTEAR